jgi:predicted amidophosphoribosyltransferase
MGDVSVLTCFCPECWKEIGPQNAECPHCGCNLSQHDYLSYEEKLLAALRHPIRENRMLAIQLLGDLRSQAALPVFRSMLETEQDFFVVREIARSLAKIGSAESEDIIRMLEDHKSRLVRKIAKEIVVEEHPNMPRPRPSASPRSD